MSEPEAGSATSPRRVLGGVAADTQHRSAPRTPVQSPAHAPVLHLYRRRGCALCDDMQQLLHELLPPDSFRLEPHDVDSDPTLAPELARAIGPKVPALFLDDRELCHHFLDLQAVRRALGLE